MALSRRDFLAGLLLFCLWLFFFWRLFTPVAADQVSFKPGDFSGQFVAFGGYQYSRFIQGEIPLWNPYNNGGMPFVADPQSAAFYPPRWITLTLSHLAGEWSYNALQLEAAFHVLALSFFMYLLVRRLTRNTEQSHLGALVAAIIAAYGGFTAGYPPLQLAVLEGSIWLPLSLLYIFEGTQSQMRWPFIAGAGLMLGMSWLAGHSQTSFLVTLLTVIYLTYRAGAIKLGLRRWMLALILLSAVTFGATAITLLPGLEYLRLATRAELGIHEKGNGFPPQDIMQVLWPGVVSLWSPLFIGISGLLLAGAALAAKAAQSHFWIAVAGFAFLLSLGHHSAFYELLYQIVPGLRYFRGQERAALLVAHSLAILAGIGAAHLKSTSASRWMVHGARALLILNGALALAVFLLWLGRVGEFGNLIGSAFFAAGTTFMIWAGLRWAPMRWIGPLLALILVFELFSAGMNAPSNYDPVPATAQLSMAAPEILQPVLQDAENPIFRVDGFRGLQANFGSLYGIADIRGISPLFLRAAYDLIYQDYIFNPLAWELFAVRYVFSERDRFGRRASELIAQGDDRDGVVFLHRLEDPRPFTHLIYRYEVIDDPQAISSRLNDSDFNARQTIILEQTPEIELSPSEEPGTVRIEVFLPEKIQGRVETPTTAILSLSLIHYPGWRAKLNNAAVPLLRAYGVLTAMVIPPGTHEFSVTYEPDSFRVGAAISLFTWGAVIILACYTSFVQRRRRFPAGLEVV